MKKIIVLILLLFPVTICALETSATSAILMDTDTNTILYEKNIHSVRSVASISKIMTAVIAIESNKLDETVTIGDEIKKAYGSGIYIKEGEELTLRDLLYGLMLRSGNDAALAIAKFIGGDIETFVDLMNNKAKELKMTNTTFNNPSGLDEEKGNYSTAYDMALLASYAIKLDEYKKITGTKKYTLTTNKNTYVWTNKNKLLSLYKYTTGGKTGYTEIAKRTLVTTATKDNTNLVVVTLNDGNDWQDHQNLFEYGFNNYTTIKLISKGNISIYNENYYDEYNLYVKNDFYYLIANDEEDSLLFKYELEKKRKTKNGDIVGNIVIYYGDSKIHEEPVYISKEKVKENKSFLDKIKDFISKLW